MYQMSCAKVGHPACRATIEAGSEDELRAKVIEHARRKHKVEMTDTIYSFMRDKGR